MALFADIKHVGTYLREGLRSRPSAAAREKLNRSIYQSALSHARDIILSSMGMRYAPGADQSRLRHDWTTGLQTNTALVSSEWKTLVARAEYAIRTGPYARNAETVILDHVVGSGLRPFAAVHDAAGEPLTDLNAQLNADWERFNDQAIRTGNNAMTVYQSQRLALSTVFATGAVLVNQVRGRADAWLPVALQLLKPTRLDMTKDSYYDVQKPLLADVTVHGMRLNEYGEVVEYNIEGMPAPVPADKMSLMFYQRECEQYLAFPWVTPILPFLWDLDQLLSDRIVASRLVARIALWLHKKDKKTLLQGQDSSDDTIPWEPGSILATETEPKVVAPNDQVQTSFAPLVRLYLHGIAAGLGFSYTLLTRDLDGVNFSSTRFNTIKDSKFFQALYRWFAHSYCDYSWRTFVRWEVLTGRLRQLTASQYLADPWRATQVYWLPEGEGWVDPQKDAEASRIMYQDGYITYEELCALRGKDWRSIAKQRAREKQVLTELGLKELLPDGNKPPAKPAAEPDKDDDGTTSTAEDRTAATGRMWP